MLILIAAAVVLIFGLGALMGAPYLPTLKKEGEAALDLLKLKPGQTILDLGSGDGSFLLQAARHDLHGIGWEINPLLVLFSKVRLFKYRKQVVVRWRNIWQSRLPKVDAIYIFGIERYMAKFKQKLVTELKKPTKIVCFAFELPEIKPVKKVRGITLYKLP